MSASITFSPADVVVDQSFSIVIEGMPTDQACSLAVLEPDGDQYEASLGVESDGDFATIESQQVAGEYRYQLKDPEGELLAEATITVAPKP